MSYSSHYIDSRFTYYTLLRRIQQQPILNLFPYTTLSRSLRRGTKRIDGRDQCLSRQLSFYGGRLARIDRKSTRLNSSHVASSYAVFCLKKKSRFRCHGSN